MATFTTKYNIDDTIYFLRENRIAIGSVRDIRISQFGAAVEPSVCYTIRYKEPGNHRQVDNTFNEIHLFPTMELLAESLIADFEKRESE